MNTGETSQEIATQNRLRYLSGPRMLISLCAGIAIGVSGTIFSLSNRAPAPEKITTQQYAESVQPNATPIPVKQFSWRDVESADYRTYIANLKAIGVPWATIVDIITADVNALFDSRIQNALKHKQQSASFWERNFRATDLIDASTKAEVAKLKQERAGVLKALLGITVNEPTDEQASGDTTKFEFLPAKKIAAVRNLEERFQASLADVPAGTHWEEEVAKLKQAKRTELEKLLTSQEMNDYLVRFSGSADSLRAVADVFAPNENQFREIVDINENFQNLLDQKRLESGEFGALPDNYSKLWEDHEAKLKSTLGDEVYNRYQKSMSGMYRTSLDFTRSAGLPDTLADLLYDERKVSLELYKTDVLGNPSEDHSGAYRRLQSNAEQRLRGVLGDRFEKYRESIGGQWIEALGQGLPPGPVQGQ